ncbi:MAG TPA: Gfo/Idh/MocA family oxidoreductase [Clostridiaceae bacterium]|nr:Gfo/Idh/MocA family oxidoreductase [Clostridiaceae bacterium]
MNKKIRVGIIGFGNIAKGAHLPGYMHSEDCEVTAICDSDDSRLAYAAQICNLPKENCFKNYKDLITSDFVDVVDICTPNHMHYEVAQKAIQAGKPFSIEKPVAMNYKESLDLLERAQKTNIPTFVCFTWRYRQHIRFMKSVIDRNEIGELYHIYIRCIKDSGLWLNRKLEWRFQKDKAGSGVLGDLGSHMFDIIRFFGQEFEGVYADSGIIVKQRQRIDSDEIDNVTTDDWSNIIAKLKNGVSATIALSRCATTISDLIEIELFGKNGAIKYTYFDGKQTIEICTGITDISGKGRHTITPPESFVASQSQCFIDLVKGKKDPYIATLEDGVKCQSVIDAALKSIEERRYVEISEITEER